MADTKKSKSNQAPTKESKDRFVVDFKEGPIVAKIWYVEGREGTSFLKFTVHRLFKSKTSDNWLSPTNYFGRNREAIHKAVDMACDFLDEHGSNPEAAFEAAETVAAERKTKKEQTTNGSSVPTEAQVDAAIAQVPV